MLISLKLLTGLWTSQFNHMFYEKVLTDQEVPKMINVVKSFILFFLVEL